MAKKNAKNAKNSNHRAIRLRGVRVHNLRKVDLDIPLGKLICVTGVSGSGKSSLAFDTLYAEGQRRYIESFSAYTRQFLERLDKPDADLIDGIPPAIAIARKSPSRSSRSTVGTVTEIADYLRLLYAKIGEVYCHRCDRRVTHETTADVLHAVAAMEPGTRFMIAYPLAVGRDEDLEALAASLTEDGFVRAALGEQVVHLASESIPPEAHGQTIHVVVDRLVASPEPGSRVSEGVETAFGKGSGRCFLLRDGETLRFNQHYRCDYCAIEYPEPEPKLYSFNSPLGACPRCQGFGNIIDVDMDLVVPDRNKTLRDGAIAPWHTPAYEHELHELLALAEDYGIPVDVPFKDLDKKHLDLLWQGVPDRDFGGLRGFFHWLDRKKYKMHIRVFLSRWRGYSVCPECQGTRLQAVALCTRLGGQHIASVTAMKIEDAMAFFASLELAGEQAEVGGTILEQIRSRLHYLQEVGLRYLTLDRPSRTLSGGESQRVHLTTALGSSLVGTLYVLDEPSIGLHKRDVDQLIRVLVNLRDLGNTVIVVEHDESIMCSADEIVDLGPGAGEAGGRVLFQGSPQGIRRCRDSLTGDYLSGRRSIQVPLERRLPEHGMIKLVGARANNLANIDVEFPLGVLCVVTGVSGSGKSTLVQDTLYPALKRRLKGSSPAGGAYDEVLGAGQIDEVVLVDQSPIGRTPRSNPVTYIKAFDEIRKAFAETVEAHTRNYPPSSFSFNVPGGRCGNCNGNGHLEIDMQFLADVFVVCPECNGTRYRPEVLEVKYRGRHIAGVLAMTVREAYGFFRQHAKVQNRLRLLMDVGLDYLRLGQPANTLSGGEAQRLKLASYMTSRTRNRCLFVLDEPTTGLHFADIATLLDCFAKLIKAGHSLVVVEHNLEIIKSADFLIELGPEAADRGGQVVATGTPEEVAARQDCYTGQFLSSCLNGSKRRRNGR